LPWGTISMMGACGRKGPLYLPEEPAQKTPAQETPEQLDVPTTPAPPLVP